MSYFLFVQNLLHSVSVSKSSGTMFCFHLLCPKILSQCGLHFGSRNFSDDFRYSMLDVVLCSCFRQKGNLLLLHHNLAICFTICYLSQSSRAMYRFLKVPVLHHFAQNFSQRLSIPKISGYNCVEVVSSGSINARVACLC